MDALAIDDTKAEYKGNKPRSRKSSEKENDGKSMNFGAVGNANIPPFGIAPWKMETAKAMAILGMTLILSRQNGH